MFGWGSVLPTPFLQAEGEDQRSSREGYEIDYYFHHPKKDNCNLCRIKTNNKRQVEKTFFDQLFKFFERNRIDLISTEKQKQLIMLVKRMIR